MISSFFQSMCLYASSIVGLGCRPQAAEKRRSQPRRQYTSGRELRRLRAAAVQKHTATATIATATVLRSLGL